MLRNINGILRRQFQVSLHKSVRTFSLSSARLSDEEEGDNRLKNDPAVKKLMATIQEDFQSANKGEEPETPKSSKNVSDLLSEIYGEAAESDDKEEKKNKFSSVGEKSFKSVLPALNIHNYRRLCGVLGQRQQSHL